MCASCAPVDRRARCSELVQGVRAIRMYVIEKMPSGDDAASKALWCKGPGHSDGRQSSHTSQTPRPATALAVRLRARGGVVSPPPAARRLAAADTYNGEPETCLFRNAKPPIWASLGRVSACWPECAGPAVYCLGLRRPACARNELNENARHHCRPNMLIHAHSCCPLRSPSMRPLSRRPAGPGSAACPRSTTEEAARAQEPRPSPPNSRLDAIIACRGRASCP